MVIRKLKFLRNLRNLFSYSELPIYLKLVFCVPCCLPTFPQNGFILIRLHISVNQNVKLLLKPRDAGFWSLSNHTVVVEQLNL